MTTPSSTHATPTLPPQSASPMAGKSVMFLVNRDEGGGVEYLARVLSNRLHLQGANCRTCFIYPGANYTAAAKVHRVIEKARLIAAAAPDVIVTFQPTASTVAAIAGRLGGCQVRIVHQSNSPAKSHPIARIMDKILGTAGAYTVTIANSRATASEFATYPAAYRNRIKLIEHGIPSPEHKLDPPAILQKFKLPADVPLLLMAARLDSQKGQAIAVMALENVPGAHLAMAGSGPERDNLVALGKKLGVLDRMHFLGHVERQDLMDLYRASTLLVFPSTWETFGLAAVEAAMTGLPVVCSDIPALREVLTYDGETTAHFVGRRNAETWARVITECLLDPNLRANSRRFATVIQQKYSEERMMQSYDALYAEIMP